MLVDSLVTQARKREPMTTPLANIADEDLATRVRSGDQDAFTQLYERHFDGAYDFALRIVRDRDVAADVVQGAFTRAWEQLNAGEPPRRFKAWLYTVARNRAIDELRQARREVALSGDRDDDDAPSLEYTLVDGDRLSDPSAALLDDDLAELVWTAAASLTPQDYSLLDMHVRQSLTAEEIAEALDIKTGNLYTRLSRLRDNLEESLTAELLRRRSRGDCAQLDALMVALPDGRIDRTAHRRILRHVERCDVCTANRRRFVSAAELLAGFAVVPAGPGLRDSVLEGVREAMQQPPGGQRGHNSGGADGARTISLPANVLGLPPALAALVAAAVLGVLALLAVLTLRGSDPLADPADASSTSHQIGVASGERVVRLAWTPLKGVTGYSVAWSRVAEELPDTTVDLPASAGGTDSPTLDDGDWYFHLRTQGGDGAWTSTLHLGPFVIAGAPSAPTAQFPPGEHQVTARFTREANSPACATPPAFADRLVFIVRPGGMLTLRQPSAGHEGTGTIAADGVFRVAQQSPAETYEGEFEAPAGGSARHTFTNPAGCTSTWDVTFAPPPHVEVIEYEGHLVPVSRLRRAAPDACPAEHWHATGPVIALDGARLDDPAPNGCGFGRVDERPTREAPAP
jgi:RNA polymerase sigma factor (sigma-70 family)